MPKQIFLVATLLVAYIGFGQNTYQLSGKIIDKVSKTPLESATIYLTSVKDSTIIDYTISDKSGNFYLKSRKLNHQLTLRCLTMDFKIIPKKLTIS